MGAVPVLMRASALSVLWLWWLSEPVSSQAGRGLGLDLAWLALPGAACCSHVSDQALEPSKLDSAFSPLPQGHMGHPPCWALCRLV